MKIKTLFSINLFLFVSLLLFGIVAKRMPPLGLLVVVTLMLSGLSTQWMLPNMCGKIAHFFIKLNRPRLGEQFARLGIAIGKPWDAQFVKGTNLPRHMSPTMSCSNFLRLALHNQGKFAEQQILDAENLKIVEQENGTAEGCGASKAKLAASLHKTGNTVKALSLANEAIDLLDRARLDERRVEVGSLKFMAGREKAFGGEKAHALFIRASILEAIRKYEAALIDREKALQVSQQTFGDRSKECTPHLTMLGKLLVKMKEFDRAQLLLQQSLDLRIELLKPDDVLISSAQLSLSDCYRERGDLDKAESLITTAFTTVMKKYKTSPGPGMAEYLQSMAFLRQKQLRYDDAGKYFKQARETYQKYFPEGHPVVYELNLRMIEYLTATGRKHEAEPLEQQNAKLLELFELAGRNVK
jgi:tetratricopeptide (TPR) repeat protein